MLTFTVSLISPHFQSNKSIFLSYDAFRKAFEEQEPNLTSKLTIIDLSGNNLTMLPVPLYRMEAATSLNLSNNNLGEVPSFLSSFPLSFLHSALPSFRPSVLPLFLFLSLYHLLTHRV